MVSHVCSGGQRVCLLSEWGSSRYRRPFPCTCWCSCHDTQQCRSTGHSPAHMHRMVQHASGSSESRGRKCCSFRLKVCTAIFWLCWFITIILKKKWSSRYKENLAASKTCLYVFIYFWSEKIYQEVSAENPTFFFIRKSIFTLRGHFTFHVRDFKVGKSLLYDTHVWILHIYIFSLYLELFVFFFENKIP